MRQFITAGDESQVVPDQSVFRRQLEAGLRGAADLNDDGYITGSELGTFLEDTVANLTRSSQTPRSGKIVDRDLDRGDFVFASPTTGRSARITEPTIAARDDRDRKPVTRSASGERAMLEPRRGGAAYYVARLRATIVADGNLPASLPLGVPGIAEDGTMSRKTALAWLAALNASGYLGHSDWRLPLAMPVNGAVYRFSGDNGDAHALDNGSIDIGYNLTAPGSRFAGSTTNELAFLYFNAFGALSRHRVDGSEQDTSANEYAPLRNVAFRSYWTMARYGDGGALAFNFGDGTQFAYESPETGGGWRFCVIVLRSGDVDADTPRN